MFVPINPYCDSTKVLMMADRGMLNGTKNKGKLMNAWFPLKSSSARRLEHGYSDMTTSKLQMT